MEAIENCAFPAEEIISGGTLVVVKDESSVFHGALGKVSDVAVGPITGMPIYEVTISSGHVASFYHHELMEIEDEADAEEPENTTSPAHYAGLRVQPKVLIVGNEMEACKGNIVKYACRAGNKVYPNLSRPESEVRDLEKVIEYATYRIDHLKEHYID